MKRVYQSMSGAQGNCFEACIASILELDLDAVPAYTEPINEPMQTYLHRLDEHLLAKRGLRAVAVNVDHKSDGDKPDRLPDYMSDDVLWIAQVQPRPGENADFNHAVVMRGSELAHDPERTYTN